MRRFTLLIPLFLLTAALWLYRIDAQSIWFDEGWSAYAAAQPNLVAAFNADATNPPLYYGLVYIAGRLWGDSEFGLRYFSLICGLITVALAYRLGRDMFGDGVRAALVTALCPLLWWAAQEARMYTLLAALLTLTAWAWWRLKERGFTLRPLATWLVLGAAELALLYAHNSAPVVVLWLNGVTVVVWIRSKKVKPPSRQERQVYLDTDTTPSQPPPQARGESERSLLLFPARLRGGLGWSYFSFLFLWLASQGIVGLLWSPYFINRFLLLPSANSATHTPIALDAAYLWRLWEALWAGVWDMVGHEPAVTVFAALMLLLAVWRIGRGGAAARWLLVHVLLLTGLLLLALGLLGTDMHGRYLVMIAPLLTVAIGTGENHHKDTKDTKKELFSWRLGGSFLFLLLGLWMVIGYAGNPAYQHDDARGMAQYDARALTSADSVVMWSYADRYELAYYWERAGVTARRVTLPEGVDMETIWPLLPTSGDVSRNVWYTQRADFRGMLGCLLADGTTQAPQTFSTYGMTDELYRVPSLRRPLWQALDVGIAQVGRVIGMGDIPVRAANQALCLPLQIDVPPNLTAELKAHVYVALERDGQRIPLAQSDATFADAAQRTSAGRSAESRLEAFPVLRLPYGTPAGAYTVYLRVYDEAAQPSGYPLTVAERSAVDIPIGAWQVTQAEWGDAPPDLPVLLHPSSVVLGGLRLLAHSFPTEALPIHNGDTLTVQMLWQGDAATPHLRVGAAEGSWVFDVPPNDALINGALLDVRVVRIPLDAPSGMTTIELPNGIIIATLQIENIPTLTSEPPIQTRVEAHFANLGTLVGYRLEGALSLQQPNLTLIWQAEATPATSYTVFVQIVDAAGQVIAQSDALPVGNSRPTTGWRAGEYLIDAHTLTFHADLPAQGWRLIAGLYDATTGQRVRLDDGTDAALLVQYG